MLEKVELLPYAEIKDFISQKKNQVINSAFAESFFETREKTVNEDRINRRKMNKAKHLRLRVYVTNKFFIKKLEAMIMTDLKCNVTIAYMCSLEQKIQTAKSPRKNKSSLL